MNNTNNNSENWSNNNNPSMVSYVGLQGNNYKQLWDWETNSFNPNNNTNGNNNNTITNTHNNTFITNQANFFDCSHLSSLPSSSFNGNLNFIPPSQFSEEYPSVDFLKKEDVVYGMDGQEEEEDYYNGNGGRIGLNLGHRTYFSSRETALIDRLFRRPRGFYQANQVPRCQAEGCKIDLSNAKHYHRRHKVCEYHSKATKVIAAGIEQRFCQQCSRFHVLAEFDQAKRSCRKRLADHNRRRRKPQPGQSQSTTDSLADKSTENDSEVGPTNSISRSEHLETSLSSSTTTFPLTISTSSSARSSSSGSHFFNGPDLSLGGEHQHQRPFIYNQQSSDMFSRGNTGVAPYHNLFFSSPNESQSMFEADLL